VSKCWKQEKNNWNCLGSKQPRLCSVWEHRTVRWCTGQCSVRQTGSGELAALGKSSATFGYNSPDCPVSQRSAGPMVGRAICARHVAKPTARRGHRTVRCAPDMSRAPTAPRRQRSASPGKERNPHRTVSGVHRTVRCVRRQKARFAFQDCSQQLLAALGL
jgi:hypothetical protein